MLYNNEIHVLCSVANGEFACRIVGIENRCSKRDQGGEHKMGWEIVQLFVTAEHKFLYMSHSLV